MGYHHHHQPPQLEAPRPMLLVVRLKSLVFASFLFFLLFFTNRTDHDLVLFIYLQQQQQ